MALTVFAGGHYTCRNSTRYAGPPAFCSVCEQAASMATGQGRLSRHKAAGAQRLFAAVSACLYDERFRRRRLTSVLQVNRHKQANTMNNQAAQSLDWSKLYQFRRATQKRYRKIWSVPIKKRHHQLVIEHLADIESILELGAGSRNFYELISQCKANIHYKSFDIDQSHPHDFARLEEIEGVYDAVCMFEVIEHVPPTLALEMLTTAYRHLKPNGLIFVTTPNTFHPPEYLRDATHITPWCYDELGAIVQHAGFELQAVYRLYQDPLLAKLVRRYLFQPLFRILGLDFAKQIIAIGRKPA